MLLNKIIVGFASERNTVHDNAVCFLKDGKIIFAENEERITRVKHDGRFPVMVLKEAFKLSKTFGWVV